MERRPLLRTQAPPRLNQIPRFARDDNPSEALLFLAQPTGVFSPGFSVTGGHLGGIAAANLAALLIFGLAANLQFQAINASEHLRVQLLDQGRITREAAWVDGLHLADEALDVTERGGLIAVGLAQIVELLHGL